MKLDAKDAVRKAAKWQQVAVEAVKQCGAAWLPEVAAPVTPDEFLQRHERFDLALIASLHGGACHPRACFEQFEAAHSTPPRSLALWIGPEGDFTSIEDAAIRASGALAVTLGDLILRADTAALYCLSFVRHELDWRWFGIEKS